MRTFAAIAGALMLAPLHAVAANAATVFFYSEVDHYYGWAAGYNYSRSERDAHRYCDEGGKACKFVLECDGGWAAVAFTDSAARGIAFSCGFQSANGARITALSFCAAEARTICWTSDTIGGGGNNRSEKDNESFDRTYYAQQMLFARGFDPGPADGSMGGKTRTALRAFQTRLGLEPTGQIDQTTFDLLLDAVGGRLGFSSVMKRDLVDPKREELADAIYARAVSPNPTKSFSEEVAARTEEQRRRTMAALLTVWGTPCAIPARSAEAVPADGTGLWLITCDQGSWTVSMGDLSHTIISSGDDTPPANKGNAPEDGNRQQQKLRDLRDQGAGDRNTLSP